MAEHGIEQWAIKSGFFCMVIVKEKKFSFIKLINAAEELGVVEKVENHPLEC
jgi:hypothetical protein